MPKLTITNYILFLIFVGFFVYLPSMFGSFVWDDEDFVYQNTYVKEFQIDKFFSEQAIAGRGKPSNYYRPIQFTLYAVIHQIFGFSPFVFHSLNIIVHIAASIVVFLFFHKLSKRRFISFLVALIFLIHPVQTEAVSYVSGLSDPLYVMFGMLSLTFFLKKYELQKWYILSLIFFFLSILSKETGLVFGGLLFSLWLIFDRSRKGFCMLLPFAGVGLLYILFHFKFVNELDIKAVWGNTEYANSLLVRMLTFIRNLYTYIGLLFFPKDLFMERDESIVIQTQVMNIYLFGFIGVNGIIAGALYKLKEKLTFFNIILFSYLSFFVSFSIYSGIVLINGIFYEHFLYLPLVFFFAFLFFCLEKFINRKTVFVFIILSILLILRSYLRQFEWIDPIIFYEQTAVRAPKSIRINNNLGIAYAETGQIDKAIEQYKKTIPLDPSIPNTYHNLANAYATKGDIKNAEIYFLKAIEISPQFHFSYLSLMNIYAQTQEKEKLQKLVEKFNKQFPLSKIELK